MHDTPLGWTTYLEDLERQAIRLRRAPPKRPLRASIAALLARLRATPPARPRPGDDAARVAVNSGPAPG